MTNFQISDLFSGFIRDTKPDPEYYSNPNAASFTFNHSSIATIIMAKNMEKIRI